MTENAQSVTGTPLPLFYQRPVPLTLDRHGSKRLTGAGGYGYAAASNAIPLALTEFAFAAKSYPIVFTPSQPTAAVAVVGVKNQQNLFVDSAGQWEQGHYVPAYVRRYPFIFSGHPESDQLVLCIDEASERLSDHGGDPLYEGQAPSEKLRSTLKFCEEFQQQLNGSQAFYEALEEADLLVEKEMSFKSGSGAAFRLSGFRMIEEERFKNLSDAIFLDWRRKGWVGLVYCHLISVSNLMLLSERAARRGAN